MILLFLTHGQRALDNAQRVQAACAGPAPNWIQMRVINAYPDIGYQLLGEGLTLRRASVSSARRNRCVNV